MAQLIVVDGPAMGRTYPIGSEETIGADPKNTVCLTDGGGASFHARLVQEDGDYRIAALPGAVLLVSGATTVDSALRHGDTIAIGSTLLLFDHEERHEERHQEGHDDAKPGHSAWLALEMERRRAEVLHDEPAPPTRAFLRAVELMRSDPDLALVKCKQVVGGVVPDAGELPPKIRVLAEIINELSDLGTRPDSEPVSLSHREAHLAVAAARLILEWHGHRPSTKPPSGPQLVVVEGPDLGRTFLLSGTDLIGSEACTVLLEDKAVGRNRLRLEARDGAYRLEILDVDPLRAVQINGVELTPHGRHPVTHGDMIQIGASKILFWKAPWTGRPRSSRGSSPDGSGGGPWPRTSSAGPWSGPWSSWRATRILLSSSRTRSSRVP